MDKPLIDKLPKWLIANKTYRAVVKGSSEAPTKLKGKEAPIEKSTLISSKVADTNNHKVLLDIDMEAELLPSSTPGHHHLYIDKDLSTEKYLKLLTALVEAGIIQKGVLDSFKLNGETSLRLPGVKKGGEFEKAVAEELKDEPDPQVKPKPWLDANSTVTFHSNYVHLGNKGIYYGIEGKQDYQNKILMLEAEMKKMNEQIKKVNNDLQASSYNFSYLMSKMKESPYKY